MGSGFFKVLNPMAAMDLPGRLAGNNSWLARMASYDPLAQTPIGKVVAPYGSDIGRAYSQRHAPPMGYAGAGYGGDASLSGANRGYIQASQDAMNGANDSVMNGTAPVPRRTIQPFTGGNPYGQ